MLNENINTKEAIENFIKVITREKILVSRMKASNIINVDHNKFNKLFVDTGLITPIIIGKQKRFSVVDVLALPDRLKEVQRVRSGKRTGDEEKRRSGDRIKFLMNKAYAEL